MNFARTGVRRMAVGFAAAAALATSGCAAGQIAETSQEKTTLDGTNVNVGDMALRGLSIATPDAAFYPSGADASIVVVIVNNGQNDDRLTGISASSNATGWGQFDDDAAFTAAASSASPSDSPSASSPSAPDTGASSATDSPSAAGTPSQSASSTAASTGSTSSITIDRNAQKTFGVHADQPVLALTGLTQRLYPGSAISITFTFAKAGSKTFQVPVKISGDGATYEPSPSYITGGASEGNG